MGRWFVPHFSFTAAITGKVGNIDYALYEVEVEETLMLVGEVVQTQAQSLFDVVEDKEYSRTKELTLNKPIL